MGKQVALDVADYLIQQAIDDDNGDLLTNLKLQKLLYYAQGCHLAIFGEPLFDGAIEAWDWGPVVPEVYHVFKVCGRQPIEETHSSQVDIDASVAVFLNVISEKFGQFSATHLLRMTHQEALWRDIYVSGMNVEMDKQRLKKFFEATWIDSDVVVEEDDPVRGFEKRLLQAKTDSADSPELTADEMFKWLEKV